MSLVWPKLASRYLLSEFSRYWIRLIECTTFQKVANILNLRGRLELKDIYTVIKENSISSIFVENLNMMTRWADGWVKIIGSNMALSVGRIDM